jgi:hypothetical protein
MIIKAGGSLKPHEHGQVRVVVRQLPGSGRELAAVCTLQGALIIGQQLEGRSQPDGQGQEGHASCCRHSRLAVRPTGQTQPNTSGPSVHGLKFADAA